MNPREASVGSCPAGSARREVEDSAATSVRTDPRPSKARAKRADFAHVPGITEGCGRVPSAGRECACPGDHTARAAPGPIVPMHRGLLPSECACPAGRTVCEGPVPGSRCGSGGAGTRELWKSSEVDGRDGAGESGQGWGRGRLWEGESVARVSHFRVFDGRPDFASALPGVGDLGSSSSQRTTFFQRREALWPLPSPLFDPIGAPSRRRRSSRCYSRRWRRSSS